jgi:hypothetical protein
MAALLASTSPVLAQTFNETVTGTYQLTAPRSPLISWTGNAVVTIDPLTHNVSTTITGFKGNPVNPLTGVIGLFGPSMNGRIAFQSGGGHPPYMSVIDVKGRITPQGARERITWNTNTTLPGGYKETAHIHPIGAPTHRSKH